MTKLTIEVMRKIKELYSLGYTTGEIAKLLDLPEVAVVRSLHKYY